MEVVVLQRSEGRPRMESDCPHLGTNNFRCFFLHKILPFFSLSEGLLVAYWWCLKPGSSKMHVWSSQILLWEG